MTQYYITASAPLTLNLAGRSIPMNPGESRGPFSESEYNIIKGQADSSRYSVVLHTPSTKEQSQPLLSKVDTPVDPKYVGYTPPETQTYNPNNPQDIFKEEVNLNPDGAKPKTNSTAKVKELVVEVKPTEEPEESATSTTKVISSNNDIDITEPVVVPKEEPKTISTRKKRTVRKKVTTESSTNPTVESADTETSEL